MKKKIETQHFPSNYQNRAVSGFEIYRGDVEKGDIQWVTTHFYIKQYRVKQKIEQIIRKNVNNFKKAIIYVKYQHDCKEMINKLSSELNPMIVINNVGFRTEQKEMRYFNFMLEEYRILITNLSPIEIFKNECIDVENVNLIINQQISWDAKTYKRRLAKSDYLDKQNKGVVINFISKINESSSLRMINFLQNELGIKFIEFTSSTDLANAMMNIQHRQQNYGHEQMQHQQTQKTENDYIKNLKFNQKQFSNKNPYLQKHQIQNYKQKSFQHAQDINQKIYGNIQNQTNFQTKYKTKINRQILLQTEKKNYANQYNYKNSFVNQTTQFLKIQESIKQQSSIIIKKIQQQNKNFKQIVQNKNGNSNIQNNSIQRLGSVIENIPQRVTQNLKPLFEDDFRQIKGMLRDACKIIQEKKKNNQNQQQIKNYYEQRQKQKLKQIQKLTDQIKQKQRQNKKIKQQLQKQKLKQIQKLTDQIKQKQRQNKKINQQLQNQKSSKNQMMIKYGNSYKIQQQKQIKNQQLAQTLKKNQQLAQTLAKHQTQIKKMQQKNKQNIKKQYQSKITQLKQSHNKQISALQKQLQNYKIKIVQHNESKLKRQKKQNQQNQSQKSSSQQQSQKDPKQRIQYLQTQLQLSRQKQKQLKICQRQNKDLKQKTQRYQQTIKQLKSQLQNLKKNYQKQKNQKYQTS